jgi:predicted homoserine dehydrogenase-like protein
MMVIDKALEKLEAEGHPIRVGLVGAGFAAKGFALQLLTYPVGMHLVAISNRTLEHASEAVVDAIGEGHTAACNSAQELSAAIKEEKVVITTNFELLCSSDSIDVIVEATGETEFGAQVTLKAIEGHKHIILINAELDATLGPILKSKADAAGVVYAQADGDQPAKLMNLAREVTSLGFKPLLLGNIKSLIDARRTPETQKAFAEAHFQRPKMITSFADGTKISMEMSSLANAMGFKVGKRGMYGPSCKRVEEAAQLFDLEELKKGGLVDYVLGAEPSFGVFVLGYSDHPIKQRYMDVYKMGKGPLYTFYVPYHLSPLEAPVSVARAAIFHEASMAPKAGLMTEVITLAKRNLKAGEKLDGIGGFTCYGTIDNYEVSVAKKLLPMGLSDGCVLNKDIPMDAEITYDDVTLPPGRVADVLRSEQNRFYAK